MRSLTAGPTAPPPRLSPAAAGDQLIAASDPALHAGTPALRTIADHPAPPAAGRGPLAPAGPVLGDAEVAAHRIVIIGGGAGGLQLAARLGRGLARRGLAEVTLVDRSLSHVWKPLLHELAAGTLPAEEDEIEFLQQADRHGFNFHLGRLESLDRAGKQVWLARLDDARGREIAPRRALPYDTLVLALGSVVNDFGTAGVAENALALDGADDARALHRLFLDCCARAEWTKDGPVQVAIVGGGATGVELAAELIESASAVAACGRHLRRLDRPVILRIIEGGPRLLGALPEAISSQACAQLERMGVEVLVNQRVSSVGRDHVELSSGERLRADITVWAAGIRGPRVLEDLDGLETNRLGQLVVRPTLQSSVDDDVFAMGDCASCVPAPGARPVPPRAQAAQQQARFLAQSLHARITAKDERPLPVYVYRDRGSLVSLGSRQATGYLIGGARRLWLSGLVARISYWSLHRQHMAMLQGAFRTALATLGRWLSGRARPRAKLH